MAKVTMTFGLLLIVLGAGAYGVALTGDKASVTALIPAFFGVPMLGLGLAAARSPDRRALLMHIAVVLAVLGLLGSARGAMAIPTLITSPDEVERPAAVIVQSIMAALCLVYVILAVRSFIAARKKST